MLGVTARSAVNHCGVPNTSLLSNELQLEYARSQIIHSSQFTQKERIEIDERETRSEGIPKEN